MHVAILRFSVILSLAFGTAASSLAQNPNAVTQGLQQRLHALRDQLISDRDTGSRQRATATNAREDWSADRKLRPTTRTRSAIRNPYVKSQPETIEVTSGDPATAGPSKRLRPAPQEIHPAAVASDADIATSVVIEMVDEAVATDSTPRRSARRVARLVDQNATSASNVHPEVAPNSKSVVRRSPTERVASREPTPTVRAEASSTDRSVLKSAPASASSAKRPTPTLARPEKESVPSSKDMTRDSGDLLVTHKSPLISVETLGPRKTVVGKESVFKVRVRNLGEAKASGVVVRIETPEWAEISSARSSAGNADVATIRDGQPLAWTLDAIASRATETLTLRIVPRKNEAFDLAVVYSIRPTTSQTMIQVQQPALALKIEGPSEVDFGQTQVYRLSISNPGTGQAENVSIQLMALDGSDKPMATQRLGTIAAGSNKVLEVELTARQAGRIDIRATVTGDPELKASAEETVVVRRAALAVEVLAPETKYAGTLATYKIRVANTGNAKAKKVRVVASLPSGAEHIESSHNGKVNAAGDEISWSLDALDVSNERVVTVKVQLAAAGANRITVRAEAHRDLTASAEGVTQVVTLADLKLEVNDPRGPVPIGEEMVYEIRLRNRGTKAAHDVDVVAFFSEGVEPISVQGGKHDLQAGQVVFQPISSLAVDEEVVFKIIAKASQAGNHIFRAEVQCRDDQTRLASEETTHFFDSRPITASRPSTDPTPAAGPRYR